MYAVSRSEQKVKRSPSLSVLADCFRVATNVIPLCENKYAAWPYDCTRNKKRRQFFFITDNDDFWIKRTLRYELRCNRIYSEEMPSSMYDDY